MIGRLALSGSLTARVGLIPALLRLKKLLLLLLLLLLMERCLLSHPGMLLCLRLQVSDLLGVLLSTIRHIRVHALPSQTLLLPL